MSSFVKLFCNILFKINNDKEQNLTGGVGQ